MDFKKLIAAFSNPEVAEAIAAALQPTILTYFIDLKSTIDNLREEIAAKDGIITNLKSELQVSSRRTMPYQSHLRTVKTE